MTSPGRLLWACRRGRRLRSAGRDWTDRICQWLALRQHDENDEEHSRHCIGDIPSARAGSRKQGRVGGSVSINIDYLWSASRTDAMNERPVRVRRQRDCRGKQMVSATRTTLVCALQRARILRSRRPVDGDVVNTDIGSRLAQATRLRSWTRHSNAFLSFTGGRMAGQSASAHMST